jgi:hypothetical protein
VFFASARRAGIPVSAMRQQVGIAEPPSALEGKPEQPWFLRDLFDTIFPRDRALSTSAAPKRALS